MELNTEYIENCVVENIDTKDYPDFADAFISKATYKGRDMTEEELDILNDGEYSDFIHRQVLNNF